MRNSAVFHIARTIDAIALALGILGAGALVVIFFLIGAEIVSRTLFSQSLSFAWEYSSYLLSTLIFCGLGWTLRTGGHIRVTMLLEVLPRKHALMADIAGAVLGTILAVLLAWAMIALCIQSYIDGTQSLLSWGTPLFIPQIPIAMGAVGFALQMALRVLLLVKGLEAERDFTQADSGQGHL